MSLTPSSVFSIILSLSGSFWLFSTGRSSIYNFSLLWLKSTTDSSILVVFSLVHEFSWFPFILCPVFCWHVRYQSSIFSFFSLNILNKVVLNLITLLSWALLCSFLLVMVSLNFHIMLSCHLIFFWLSAREHIWKIIPIIWDLRWYLFPERIFAGRYLGQQ